MNARWLILTLLGAGVAACGPEDSMDCEFIGYDLYNTTGRHLGITSVGDAATYLHTEVFGQPVEFHAVQICDEPPPDPLSFPDLIATDIDQAEPFLLSLDEDDWSGRRRDPMRGYDYFRAQIDEDDLVPMSDEQ